MAVLHVHVSALLLVAVSMVSCRVDCPYGEFLDGSACAKCSPCPASDILSPSYQALPCYSQGYTCPDWCSSWRSPDPPEDTSVLNDACYQNKHPPTTPSPVPFVNVTIDEPVYNATTKTYAASCTIFFSNMGAPSLEWSDPSGQVLAPTDASGKWIVQQGQVTQDAMTEGTMWASLQVKDFQKEDEGNYTCSAQGEESANQMIFLQYVKPPVITSSPSPTPTFNPTSEGSSPPNSHEFVSAKSDTNSSPKSDTNSSPKGLSRAEVLAIVFGVVTALLCIIFAFFLKRQRYSSSRNSSEDIEKLPLTDLRSQLSLRTSDFERVTVEGIQACLDLSCCAAVVICRKNKKNITVRNEKNSVQNTVYISDVSWNDKIEVWMKYRNKKKKFIEMLSMPCLKIVDVTETSAVINCPNVADTFFLRYGEKGASFQPAEPMQGGRKEICDLRPGMTYCVELGTRGQDGDTGAYNWGPWKDDFTTKGLKFQPVEPKASSAKLQLQMDTLPESLDLHYVVNSFDDSKLKKMESCAIDIQDLIPDMDQVVQFKVKERRGSSEECKLLLVEHFKTTGKMEYGGDYNADDTTDAESFKPPGNKSKRNRRNVSKESSTACTTKCTTGLKEALHNLRLSQGLFYNTPNPDMSQAVMECLREVYRMKKESRPDKPGNVKKLQDVEAYFRHGAVNYTGVFDILRQFIQLEEMHTQAGIDYATHFLNAHNSKCRFCEHACFLLRWYTEKKKKVQPSGS